MAGRGGIRQMTECLGVAISSMWHVAAIRAQLLAHSNLPIVVAEDAASVSCHRALFTLSYEASHCPLIGKNIVNRAWRIRRWENKRLPVAKDDGKPAYDFLDKGRFFARFTWA